jgi:hypothetical protein
MSLFDQASLIVTPNAYKAGKLYAIKPDSGAGDLDVVRATSATRVNSAGLIEVVGNNVPRLDYPPLGGCPSILVEPQRTNHILNTGMQGAIVGTPGVLPTTWNNGLIGLTQQIIGLGVENGLNYIDIRFSGTSGGSGTALQRILFNQLTQITATPSQTWTLSCYLKLISVPNPPISTQLVFFDLTNLGGFIAVGQQSITPDNSFKRFSYTRTTSNNVNTARIQTILQFSTTTGQFYDFTFRLYAPQLELGSNATSYIPTVESAVTRNADVITLTGLSGSSVITETFENNTTNVITDPTSYQMSQGRIKLVTRV